MVIVVDGLCAKTSGCYGDACGGYDHELMVAMMREHSDDKLSAAHYSNRHG